MTSWRSAGSSAFKPAYALDDVLSDAQAGLAFAQKARFVIGIVASQLGLIRTLSDFLRSKLPSTARISMMRTCSR